MGQSSYTITENHHAPFPTPPYVPTCRQNCESPSCWRGCPDLQGVCTKCATWRMKELQGERKRRLCEVRTQHVMTRDQCHDNFSSKSLGVWCLTRPVLAPPLWGL